MPSVEHTTHMATAFHKGFEIQSLEYFMTHTLKIASSGTSFLIYSHIRHKSQATFCKSEHMLGVLVYVKNVTKKNYEQGEG